MWFILFQAITVLYACHKASGLKIHVRLECGYVHKAVARVSC